MWIPPQEKRPCVFRPELTPHKTMISLVFTGNGKVSVSVTERGETISNGSYVEFIRTTDVLWQKLQTDSTKLKELLWMHDNAQPHSAVNTRNFLNMRKVKRVKQSPYSPDFNPCDRWFFKNLKNELRHCHVQCAYDVRFEVLRIFREIPSQRFEMELLRLKAHCELVISCHGDYVTN